MVEPVRILTAATTVAVSKGTRASSVNPILTIVIRVSVSVVFLIVLRYWVIMYVFFFFSCIMYVLPLLNLYCNNALCFAQIRVTMVVRVLTASTPTRACV